MKDRNNATKVVTGLVRFSYVQVYEPKSINGSEPKFSCSLIIDKSDAKTLNEIKQAIAAATEIGKVKLGGRVAGIKTPLRDGDVERPDDEAYANAFFINANAKNRPGVVDKNVKTIMDPSELYSGCYGKASITFYAYNANGNKGIACALNHLQKIKDGEPLGGRTRAEDDFTTADDDDFLS